MRGAKKRNMISLITKWKILVPFPEKRSPKSLMSTIIRTTKAMYKVIKRYVTKSKKYVLLSKPTQLLIQGQ